ncbi:zinc-alpha-2-glycoprotein-like isoform X2 [Ctenopharyngodon idella]|uniref:zinc-alpha-2-glycoprotein-like isoform X2 n=1 Tax=Ctenopharyngodon idella TaxID=7959 RepID=UPI002230905F|nr:zinc-alpha-2-glycoprotein-like isoform X2 [Ctenopharyngodon idella]
MVHTSKNIFFIELVWLIFHPFLSDEHQDEHKEKHFLHYKFTALTKADTFPEFSAVVVADDRRIKHFSNEERVWILTEDDWTEPPEPPDSRDWFIHQIRTLTNCENSQCSELHVLQRIIGCELEKLPDGTVNLTVFDEYGFDGEDFISFNSDTVQWIDKNPKAKETKMKWDRHTERNKFLKYFLKNCMNWISTFNNTKQSSPDVRVSVRKAPDDSNLVLTCLATGFYPRDVQMNIRLNRNILEDQTSGIRPNDDETFQMRISVKINRNHEGSYDCLVNHRSLTEPVLTGWAANCADCETNRPPILVITIILLVVAGSIIIPGLMTGYIKYKRRRLMDENRRYGESEENVSSYDCNREMMKRSEPHPPHTDQLSSFDDKNELEILNGDRGEMCSNDCKGRNTHRKLRSTSL